MRDFKTATVELCNLNYYDLDWLIKHTEKAEDVADFVKCIVRNNNEDFQFFNESQSALLTALIAYQIECNEKNNRGIKNLKMMLNWVSEEKGNDMYDKLDMVFEGLKMLKPDSFAVHTYRAFRCIPIQTSSNIYRETMIQIQKL